MVHQSSCAVLGGGRGKGNGVWPAGSAVHNSEQVCEPIGGGVGVPLGPRGDEKMAWLDWYVNGGSIHVVVNFGSLAHGALALPFSYVGREAGPNIAGGDEPSRGANSGVRKVVDVAKNSVAKGSRHIGAKNP